MVLPKTLARKRDELLEAARDNPGSEAGEMLQALLLAGISRLESEQEEAELELEDERERFQVVRRQSPRAGSDVAAITVIGGIQERDDKLERVRQAAAEAQAALAAGQTLDALAVCNRIAEIVGLRAPEPQSPDPSITQSINS